MAEGRTTDGRTVTVCWCGGGPAHEWKPNGGGARILACPSDAPQPDILAAPGCCLNCQHPEDAHGYPESAGEPRLCDTEVSDYGNLDCSCPGLKLCAACEGDPEAHGLHVCGRT